ncbi:WD40 repeat domain-containing protein, partial [Actinoplanes sp. NPDC024001]|uniref:WD40 repeat domain-containing protein n=1 Tax=Actinoplanes sp. NPDC024001 TaxID=3154598 RepID=UPI0033CF663F
RGVAVDAEAGYRFRGRRAALRAVTGWLDRATTDDRVLVITGSPGVGKSAVLGRVVTTADAGIRAALPADDDAVRARIGSVACAVHVKGKHARDVAVEIARAAAVRLPDDVRELAPALAKRLADRSGERFNLVLDALDEAVTPGQAQQIVEEIVLPIARTCGRAGAQVVVGTRRSDDGGDLLRLFGPDRVVVDLDDEQYFEVEDLTAYAAATLRLVGAERDGNPYADPAVAEPVAARIAELADRNFLVAGLTARRHGLYDTTPADPGELDFSSDVDAALDAYVARLPNVGGATAKLALTALAYAQAPGLPAELWQVALAALGAATGLAELGEFARSSAANFIVEASGDGPAARFRLFHQALDDALRRDRGAVAGNTQDQRQISDRLIRYGRSGGWAVADPYLLRSLPQHAAAGGVIDELLDDDEYLLYADLQRLVPAADWARSILAQQRARLLRLTPQATGAGPAERAAMFSVTAAIEALEARVAVDHRAPYRAAWAALQRRMEWAVLEGHTGEIRSVCSLVTRDGRTLLASGAAGGTVRLWDPDTGQQDRQLRAGSAVVALRPVSTGGRTLLGSAGEDGVVRLWDPDTGQERHRLTCSPGQVRALFPVYGSGAAAPARAGGLGIVGHNGAVSLWEPAAGAVREITADVGEATAAACDDHGTIALGGWTGLVGLAEAEHGEQWRVEAHDGPVTALCHLIFPGGALVASAAGSTVRLWETRTGRRGATLRHPGGQVRSMCALRIHGADLLAAAGDDGTVLLWDPRTGTHLCTFSGHVAPVLDLCAVTVRRRPLLASAGDNTVRLWDLDTRDRTATASPRAAEVTALVPAWHGDRALVACGHGDGLLRLRNAATGAQRQVLTGPPGPVTSLTTMRSGRTTLLCSTGADQAVRMWILGGGQRPRVADRPGATRAVCAVLWDRRECLACADEDGVVRLWDPGTGRGPRHRRTALERFRRRAAGHTAPITVLCRMPPDSAALAASGGEEGTVRLWETSTGRELIVLVGHQGPVRAACPLGRGLLATAGDDRTLRVWDVHSGAHVHTFTGHTGAITGVCTITAYDGRTLLASTSHDATVRLWDPVTGRQELAIPVHHQATACVATAGLLIVGTTAGTLALSLNPDVVPPA